MDIAIEPQDADRAVLALTGRLDLLSAAELRAAVKEVVELGRHRLVLDLSRVPFIDSSGLGALVGTLKHAREAGGELRIAGAVPEVLDVLSLLRLDRILQPYPNRDEALEGL